MPKGKAGKGSHGSLSKAGKSRGQNPKQFARGKNKHGKPFWNNKRSKIPRIRNRRNYEKRDIN